MPISRELYPRSRPRLRGSLGRTRWRRTRDRGASRSAGETLRSDCLLPGRASCAIFVTCFPDHSSEREEPDSKTDRFQTRLRIGVVCSWGNEERAPAKKGARAGTKRERSVSPDLRMGWWAHPRICVPTRSVPALHRRLNRYANGTARIGGDKIWYSTRHFLIVSHPCGLNFERPYGSIQGVESLA